MAVEPKTALRLQFLARVVRKECKHLITTDQRLFAGLFTLEHASQLEENLDLAERVETFVGRFGRLQDTVGEKPSAAIDNLDRAERLGLINSADGWMTMRNLRNQMVHEYVEDPVVLTSALQSGHVFVQALIAAADKMIARNRAPGLGVMQNAALPDYTETPGQERCKQPAPTPA